MSYCELKKITPKGYIKTFKIYRNSWGGAYRIWDSLYNYKVTNKNKYGVLYSETGECQKVWDLYYSNEISVEEKIVLGLTFDYAVVKKENIKKLSEALLYFDEKYTAKTGIINHLPKFAEDMLNIGKCHGICFHPTSVAKDYWESYPFRKGDKHFYVFDET